MDSKHNTINSEILIDLSEVNIPASLMKFKNISLQSDRIVCVRSNDHVSIVDIASRNVAKLNTAVDSLIINPTKNIVGLKAGNNLQVFDLTKKIKLNSAVINSSVEYWQWIDDDTIALVTSEKVYHWLIPDKGEPLREFEREPFEGHLQIISYKTSHDKKWLVLGGIAAGEEGGIDGVLQLYSKARKRSQIFKNSHAGCFARLTLSGRESPCDLFCFTHRVGEATKLSVVEVAAEKEAAFRLVTPLSFQSERDFAVSLQADEKNSMAFLLTKQGFLFVTDIVSGTNLFSEKISAQTIFMSVPVLSGGIVTVGQDGMVRKFSLRKDEIVRYLTEKNPKAAVEAAIRLDLPMEPELARKAFDQAIRSGDYQDAAHIAHCAPNNSMRTKETIDKFSALPVKPGQVAPVLQYFSFLLKKGKLNEFESLKLVGPIANSNTPAGRKHIEQWIRAEKLTPSEALGDILIQTDAKLACSMFLRVGHAQKAIDCFLLLGRFDKVKALAQKSGLELNYASLLEKLLRLDREKAKDFATEICAEKNISAEEVVDVFMAEKDFKNATSFMLDYFKERGDREEDAALQTRLLAINVSHAPQVAEAILESEDYRLSHYDRAKIAGMCEESNLLEKALENYENLDDIKRCLKIGVVGEKLSKDFVVQFFGEMSPDEGTKCLEDLLDYDVEQNLDLVVEIATAYAQQMTPKALAKLFESAQQPQGLFRFLGSVVNTSEDPEIVFKYIEAAAETGEFSELKRVCKENSVFDAERAKRFLFERSLPDPRPLIILCDRFGYIDEMTRHLFRSDLSPFIEAYVSKMNCAAAPAVVAALLDLNAAQPQIESLLSSLRAESLGEETLSRLVEETSNRGRIAVLLPWLEEAVSRGSGFAPVHNALGRVYIEQNLSPESFLATNKFYSRPKLGAFCEERDMRLAFAAYSGARGECDADLLRISRASGFYSELAQLLVERQDEQLWVAALGEDDEHRRALIAQVVAALGKSRDAEEVSVAVKAFIAAELPKELIALLERLVLTGPAEHGFRNNKNLQNLLILTAMKADPPLVMSYLSQLSDYDGPDIAKIAISDHYKLYEEAFQIYVRFDKEVAAANVVLEKMKDLPRAQKFAERVDRKGVWERLGEAQLAGGLVSEALGSFKKGGCVAQHDKVIKAASEAGKWDELAEYLQMVRGSMKTAAVDADLLYAFAKTGRLEEFRELLPKASAKIEDVGYRCMEEDLYDAARALYQHTKSYGKLAICLVNLGEFESAVEAAQNANNVKTWKVVCYACVDAGEFSLAKKCALRVVVHADQLPELLNHYEQHGYFEQLLSVLESAVEGERASSGLITALGVLYCKYKPAPLMAHLKQFAGKLHIQQLSKKALEFHLWPEAVFLFTSNNQFDRAAALIIEHSPSCFDDQGFQEIASKVTNSDLLMKIIEFYVAEHPLLLGDLLRSVQAKIDPLRVVKFLEEKKILPLAEKYLFEVQKSNLLRINKAVNQLLVKEENVEKLKQSIETYSNYESEQLIDQLKTHKLRQFRALSAKIYNKNGQFEKAIEILRKDDLFEEMVETACLSKSREIAENLLHFFVQLKKPFLVSTILLRCRNLLRPHVALEIGWKNGLNEYVMPFVIQNISDFDKRMEKLEKENEERKRLEEKENSKKALNNTHHKNKPLSIMSSARIDPKLSAEIELSI